MGFFDWVPCCGPRVREEKDRASISEQTTLLRPNRPGSILSEPGYCGLDGSTNSGHVTGVGTGTGASGGLRAEQRARIEEIGREVGNFMLPINPSRNPGFPKTLTMESSTSTPPRTHPSSPGSSRPSSPSPLRPDTSPVDGRLKSPVRDGSVSVEADDGAGRETEAATAGDGGNGGDGEEEEVVVRKQVFMGSGGMGGGRKSAGRGRPRGRGPRRGK